MQVGTLFYGQTFALENKLVLMLPASTGLLQPLLLADCLSAVLSLQQKGWTCLLLYLQTPCWFGFRRWPHLLTSHGIAL